MHTFSLYDGAVPHVTASLDALNHLFDKLEAHATQSKISTETFITANLAPDMFPFAAQIYIAANMALQIAVHLQGIEPPAILQIGPHDLKTLDDLRNHVRATQEIVQRIDRKDIVHSGAEVVWNLGPVEKKTSSAYGFVNGFSIPTLYFHVVTAYDILRKSGVEIGKADYLNHFLDRFMA
ncbi:hypothetical protein BFJ71_g15820 [Fusarium oxysporum]|nr:hypothetical protein BFJ71_g15820 [Fusarium oxysporum]